MNYNFAWQSVSSDVIIIIIFCRTFCEDVREAHMFTTELRI